MTVSHRDLPPQATRPPVLVEPSRGRASVGTGPRRVSGDAVHDLVAGVTWVYPNRPLTREFDRITTLGYLKGADLWHLACALFLAPDGRDLAFMTLDQPQQRVAARLGFSSEI
jgi:hypothetical protein